MKCGTVHCPHVFTAGQLLHVIHKIKQFAIIFIIVPRYDGNSIVYLVTKRVRCVIYYDHILNSTIMNHTQIFDINTFNWNTTVPVQSVVYKLSTWI